MAGLAAVVAALAVVTRAVSAEAMPGMAELQAAATVAGAAEVVAVAGLAAAIAEYTIRALWRRVESRRKPTG